MHWFIIYRYPDADEERFATANSFAGVLWWALLRGRKLAYIKVFPAKALREQHNPLIDGCPHCGGIAEYKTFRNYDGHVSYETGAVVCTQCGAQTKEEITSGYYGIAVSSAAIIRKWNRRCGR